jgi:hypothetical protein
LQRTSRAAIVPTVGIEVDGGTDNPLDTVSRKEVADF